MGLEERGHKEKNAGLIVIEGHSPPLTSPQVSTTYFPNH